MAMDTVEGMKTALADLHAQYEALCKTPIMNYSMGERSVAYEQRKMIHDEITRLERRIAAREKSFTGHNLVSFSK